MLVTPVRYGNLELLPREHALGPLGRLHFYSGYRQLRKSASELTSDVRNLSPAALSRPAYFDAHLKFSGTGRSYWSFLRSHTLLNYYSPFVPGSLWPELDLTKCVKPSSSSNVKHLSNWRSCQGCVALDVRQHGFPFFHLEHQLPTATQCALHRCALTSGCLSCSLSWSRLECIGMPPPGNKCLKCGGLLNELDNSASSDSDVAWILATSLHLLRSDSPPVSHKQLQCAYRKWLGVDLPIGPLNLRERGIVADAQFELDSRFHESLYRAFLVRDQSEKIKKRSSNLSVFKAAFSADQFIPPIFHLLIIRMMFGDMESIPL